MSVPLIWFGGGPLRAMGDAATALGRRVKSLRKLRSLSVADLAAGLSVSEEWVRRIEAGTGRPSLETIEALADQLGVPISELFERTDSEFDSKILRVDVAGLSGTERDWLERLVRLAIDHPAGGVQRDDE